MYAKGKEVKNPDSRIAIKGIGIGAVIGIVLGLVFGINSALNYAEGMGQSIYYFFLTFATTVMMYTPFLFIVLFVPYILAKKKSERVNKKCLKNWKKMNNEKCTNEDSTNCIRYVARRFSGKSRGHKANNWLD